jgi:hypothetical protein
MGDVIGDLDLETGPVGGGGGAAGGLGVHGLPRTVMILSLKLTLNFSPAYMAP